jgi:pantothenate kinase
MDQIIKFIKSQESIYLIGVGGIPGSGKSTFASCLQSGLKDSIIVPLDGYHFYRKDLDEEGLRRRGADFTFDKEKFRIDLENLKKNKEGYFSSFDHSVKDP